MLTDRALPVLLGENTSERSRRVAGAVIGLSLGLLYGATSGWINSVLLWGIPLRVDLAKITLDIISAGAGGMVAGYIAAWSQSSFKSVVAGAAAIALFGAAKALVAQAGGAQFFALIIILVTIFLPSVALSLPITLVIRLAVNWREDASAYLCPCHDAKFSLEGEVLDGPPPRPLDRFAEHRLTEDGTIEIFFKGA